MNHNIQLVALDLDGTLLNSRHQLSKRNQRAIQRAIEQGVEVVIATGKTRHAAEQLIEELGIVSPGVYMQGLITYNADGSVRSRIVMSNNVVDRVIALGKSCDFGALVYSDNRTFAERIDEVAIKMTEYGEPNAETIVSWLALFEEVDVNKVILSGDECQIASLRDEIDRQLNGSVHVTRANVEGIVEILPANTSKGQAVKTLMREMDIAPQHALAVGDGENDIEMLNSVGIGLAMGNAVQMLKNVADAVVPNNDEDGVAIALETFVLGEKVGSL